jgi:hypothetical protein
MILHLVSDLNRALEIKARLNCPHIHFVIEKDCGAFTTSLVWMEVLTRASDLCRKEGACVVSHSDLSSHNDTLSHEDIKFLQKMQSQLNEKMVGIEVIKNEALGR